MISIKIDTEILSGDLIYNPTKDETYEVIEYPYHLIKDETLAYLKPVLPFRTTKEEFTMPIDSIVNLRYKLLKQRTELL